MSSKAADLQPYTYQELSDNDIRLATLLPGEHHDGIKVTIHHTSLSQASTPPETRTILSLEEIQATLPAGWKAYETVEGRILFSCWSYKRQEDDVTWNHPVPGFDPSLYQIAPEPKDHPATAPPSKYEALSYTWGPAGRDEPITIVPDPNQLQGHNKVLLVRENLATALRHLRQTEKPRVLWIDQLCINQPDTLERARQVSRMAEIYTSAWRVVVWLGTENKNDDDSGSDAAIDALVRLGSEVQVSLDYSCLPTPGGQHPSWSRLNTPLPIDGRTWLAIDRLLSRPWFERMWIVQEVFCANRRAVVQCGRRVVRWLVSYRAVHAIAPFQRPRPPYISTAAMLRILCLTYDRLESRHGLLSRILSRSRGRKCSDERDRVYGLLALLSPAFRAAIRPPSYDVPTNDVFVDVTLAHIRHVRRLELLLSCNLAHRVADGVPSWVPNFSTAIDFSYYTQFAAGHSECFYATTVGARAGLLRVLGVRCAVVRRTAAADIERETLSGITARLASGMGVGVESDARTAREPCFRELLARAMAGDLLDDRFPYQGFPSVDAWCSALDAVDGTGRRGQDEDSPLHMSKAWHSYKSSTAGFVSSRLFLITKEGLLGIGPANSRQGDVVVVLLGCSSPMLLRPGPSPGEYLVVGECHSVNLQDATALLGPLPPPGRVEVVFDGRGGDITVQFLDPETGSRTNEDPRLPPLPPPWVAVDNVAATGTLERSLDDPYIFRRFRNRETGEVVNSDPRMSPDALRARGLALEYFTLA
ncbi:hypothetical protein MAPG_11544 [Magnaporthiopsis poae ATCC 64411]|uniref:Heterokaryon incompatibility domain-containing protein n=1 Tax=Magnaporthiopsis poae (strain ATCC 64411 / 73-15) TaxID=644358 RepID=A0A0C4EFJ4_MAGP6|nr:hypothetical protein MAPG_11544 [Magnaporthiopsis poae ATCC 64411]